MSQRLTRQASAMTDAARETLKELGHVLRDARQARGLDLYDVADHLRIKPSYLFALEQGDLGLTPGRPYALGFLRTYAEHLGFAGGEVVAHVRQALDATTARQPLHYRTPIAESTRPGGFVVGLSIVLAAMVYGTWHLYFRDEPMIERVAAVPGELGRFASGILELDEAPGPQTAQRPVPSSPPRQPVVAASPAAPSPSAPAVVTTAPLTVVADSPLRPPPQPTGTAPPLVAQVPALVLAIPSVPPPSVARWPAAGGQATDTPVAAAAPSTSAPPSTPGEPAPSQLAAISPPAQVLRGPDASAATAQPVSARELLAAIGAPDTGGEPPAALSGQDEGRVTLVAREPAWVQVQSGDRDFVRTKTMETGERMALPNRADLALWTGNAGGLEIVVDGRSVGTLGQRGRVMRDVSLAPDSLRARFDTLPR